MYIHYANRHSFHKMKFIKPKLTAVRLQRLVDAYFTHIEGDHHIEYKPPKNAKDDPVLEEVIIYDRKPEPPTLTGLALYLGFNSRQEFENYERKPRFGIPLKRARLRIEAEYEKKLHLTSAAGAIFALRSLGWNEDREPLNPALKTLEIKILDNGPSLAQTEKEVTL